MHSTDCRDTTRQDTGLSAGVSYLTLRQSRAISSWWSKRGGSKAITDVNINMNDVGDDGAFLVGRAGGFADDFVPGQ